MQQTLKRYKKIGNNFLEDANGFCIGFEWLDSFNIHRRVIYTLSTDDLIRQRTNTVCEVQLLDPSNNEWKSLKKDEFVAHQRTYINVITGQIEPAPFIVETDIIDGVSVDTQVLKPNLKTEFEFLYDYQFQIFENVLKGIQAREFGATSFL